MGERQKSVILRTLFLGNGETCAPASASYWISSAVRQLLSVGASGVAMMSLVRLLGFRTLGCGCVTGHYREVATSREVTYVEEKGLNCEHSSHRRNHTVASPRADFISLAARAS